MRRIDLAGTVAVLIVATPALAQATNEGLLNYNMGRWYQRLKDQSASIGLIGEAYRESELQRCLEIVAGGSPLPSECLALVPRHRSSKRQVGAKINPVPAAPVPTTPRKVRAKTASLAAAR